MVAERVAAPIRGSVVDFGAFSAMLAFQKLASGLQGVPAVVKVAHANSWTPTSPRLVVWVLMLTEDIEAEKQVYLLDRAFKKAVTSPAIEVEVVYLDQGGESVLGDHSVIFERG